jgi:hypothetical protein
MAVGLLVCALVPAAVYAQAATEAEPQDGPEARGVAAIAVTEAALDAITAGDWAGLADLMIDEAVTVMTSGGEDGFRHRVTTTAETRASTRPPTIVERGFDPEVRVAGTLAVVWFPYDLYVDGDWSHCGVDTFTVIETAAGWKIAALAYTIEQPPACKPHPDGPPR